MPEDPCYCKTQQRASIWAVQGLLVAQWADVNNPWRSAFKSEVATLEQHSAKSIVYKTQLDDIYTKSPAPELKSHYDTWSAVASQIDEDIKEANRRKPKKAKTDKTQVKDESP